MSKYKDKKQTLSNLLFSEHGDDSRRLSPQHSYNEIEEGDDEFHFNMPHEDKEWQSNDNIENQFLKLNGPCVQFSQNFSQNSMMYSHRQDDDSREYKQQQNNYLRLLEGKKKEEILFNQALEQELLEIKKERDRMQLQNAKLQTLNKGFQNRIKEKERSIQKLEEEIKGLECQIQDLKVQNDNYLKAENHKNNFIQEYKKSTENILAQLDQKIKQNNLLKKDILYLQSEIQRLNKNLTVYNEPDRKLYDFRNPYTAQPYESPLNSKKNPPFDKELQKLRKDKNGLQIELSALKDKLQDRDARTKQIEQQNKKKVQLKQKKIAQLEQRINQFKEEQLKLKTQNEVAIEKLTNNLNSKNKQIGSLNEKVNQNQKRIKALFEETRKKDERIKEISLQNLQKNRYIAQSEKNIEEMKVKLDFDHQMIQDKDKDIEKLLDQKKAFKMQLQNNEKTDKSDKADKIERQKLKRQVEKLKKEVENAKRDLENDKKDIQALTKENQQLQNTIKQHKRKLDQVSKRMQQMRNSNAQLQQQTRNKQEQSAQQRQALEKAMRQLTDYKKKSDSIPELRNKIILLESRLKASQNQYRQTGESFDSTSLQDRIEILQHKLEDRDKQNRTLKAKLKNQAQNSDYQLKELEDQISERDQQIEGLIKQNQQLKKDLAFKDQTLDFTHKILVKYEKEKIQLEQEKKMLEQMVHGEGNESFEAANEELTQFYQQKIQQLEIILKKKDDQHRFDVKQLKQRVREVNDMLLNKQRRITPETMSPQDTVNFLIKTIKKVNKSADMLRTLSKNPQFRQGLTRMQRQFKK